MRIEAEQRVAAPPESVFDRVADLAGFEERARRRGMPVERLADDPPAWRLGVDWHGITAAVELGVEALDAPRSYVVGMATRGVGGCATVEVVPDAGGSILRVRIDAEPSGMKGRMLVQTLRLALPKLEGRLSDVLARLAAEIEDGADGEPLRPMT